jgi:chaperonin GroEL
MKRVGRDGVITIGESTDAETTLQVVEGMQIDRGWLAYPFITDPERLEAVLNEPYILLTERKLFTMTPELDTVLAQVGQSGRPVLIIAGDFDQPFVISLIHNNQLGVLRSVAVKAPAFGDLRRAMLEDMALVTGAYAFTEDCGRPLSTVTMDDLGRAVRVTVGQSFTTIAGGYGDEEGKNSRMTLLRSLIDSTENDLDRERLKQRLARLASGVAVIKVGAVTEGEMRERKDRVDDAVCATRSAVMEGIVPGGGKALLLCTDALQAQIDMLAGDEKLGAQIVLAALESPTRQIAANAGMSQEETDFIVNVNRGKVDRRRARWWSISYWCRQSDTSKPLEDSQAGWNAATDRFENLVETGVIDPARVVRCSLQNAASVSALLLTTQAMVASFPDKK